jgi:AraC family transcriptional regulator
MNRVLDHIDAHLADDLRLETLADVAAFSPFHFHRVFRAWTGETLLDFVRRRRLETAGGRLRHAPRDSITTIAFAVGFESGEAFSRAFKLHFGMTPTAWRRGGQLLWERRQRMVRTRPAPAGPRYTVVLKQLPEREVLYWRAQGRYDAVVSPAWVAFTPYIAALGLAGQLRLGMGLDDPDIAPVSRCRFDACVVLPPNWHEPISGPVSRKRVAGGLHACLSYDGPGPLMQHAWRQLLNDWLPTSGLLVGDTPFFEIYPVGQPLPAQGPVVICELCMPVQR